MSRTSILVVSFALLAMGRSLAADPAAKQKHGDTSPPTTKAAKEKTVPGFTAEREAAAMTFVQRHHPELAELLIHLKEHRIKQYHGAIRDLFRTSERLAQIREKDVERYRIELESWKLKSRIQLLAVRLRMTPMDDALRQELRQALLDQFELQKTRLIAERARVEDRLNKLDAQLERMQNTQEDSVEARLKSLTSSKRPRTDKPQQPAGRKPRKQTNRSPLTGK